MRTRRSTNGFTLLELVIALTILVLVSVNITMVSRTGSQAARSGAFRQTLNDEADQTLDRISLALMSSDAENIYPIAVAPLYTNEVTFNTSLGVEGGEVIQSPPESIVWQQIADRGRVIWSENPGLPSERSVTWSNWVPTFFAGEEFNGKDDNENIVVDESGLAFDMEGDLVNIHLTVERQGPDGKWLPTTRSVQITCRN
jgi:prepilin-type N-terminal cleavage/methylation domain-containing protein